MTNLVDQIDHAVGLDTLDDYDAFSKRIASLSAESFWDFVSGVESCLPTAEPRGGLYRVFGGAEMSGLGLCCTALECRRKGIEDGAAYATFYCDELILYNPISRIFDTAHHTSSMKEPLKDLWFHLKQLFFLVPLIRRGIVSFIDFERQGQICKRCLSRALHSVQIENRSDLYVTATKHLMDTSKVSYVTDDGRRSLRIDFDSPLVHGHDTIYQHSSKLQRLKKWTDGTRLTPERVVELNVFGRIAELLSNDLINSQLAANSLAINTAVTRQNELEILKQVFGERSLSEKFDASFPMISSRNLELMLEIRDKEWHHFEEFRSFIFNYDGSAKDAAKAVRNEVIRLEKIVQKNVRTARGKLIDGLTASAAVFGGYALGSGISAAFGLAAASIGAGHFAKKMIPELRRQLSEPEEIRESTLYLAWKFHQTIRR